MSANVASDVARRTHLTFAAMLATWCGVWIGKVFLDSRVGWSGDERAAFLFWLVAKIGAWLLPAVLLIHASGRSMATIFNVREWRRWAWWGTTIGFGIAVTGIARKWLAGQPLFDRKLDFATLNVLVVAPLFEEFLMRAAVLGNLTPSLGGARANAVSAFYFVALHLPGWYMLGRMSGNLTQSVGGALSIFVLGLLFGWVMQRGRSFLGAAIAHLLNNLVG